MSDPIRFMTGWSYFDGRRQTPTVTAGQIIRQDPLWMAEQLIARHELRVWFEPDWRNGRYLARRFPHCLIYSIPVESNTLSLRKVPGWRPRRNFGVV